MSDWMISIAALVGTWAGMHWLERRIGDAMTFGLCALWFVVWGLWDWLHGDVVNVVVAALFAALFVWAYLRATKREHERRQAG